MSTRLKLSLLWLGSIALLFIGLVFLFWADWRVATGIVLFGWGNSLTRFVDEVGDRILGGKR